jgi:predicted Zn-dependent protease
MPSLPATLVDITIRYLDESDFDADIDFERDDVAKRFVGGAIPKSREQLLSNLQSYQATTELTAIAESETGAYIGRCGFLDTASSDVELHIVLGPTCW